MLALLKIKNIALIDETEIEFGPGLNLLTGETGSGKSIIVDSLGALTGDRVSSDLVKDGAESAQIEGLFLVSADAELRNMFRESGIELEGERPEIIIRREISLSGKNRIHLNNQLITATFLKKLGTHLVDIHGQGEQAALFDTANHLEMLDEYAGLESLREKLAVKYAAFTAVQHELRDLKQDDASKLQLMDVLNFQAREIRDAAIEPGEDDALEEEKRRLNNIEKLSSLSDDAYSQLYENQSSTLATLDKVARDVSELAAFDSQFSDPKETLENARVTLEDLAITLRDFRNHLQFSPERLAEIEDRLARISGIKRKYGGTIESALAHLVDAEERLKNIETAEFREEELMKALSAAIEDYMVVAREVSEKRAKAARKFEKETEENLKAVALDKAKFEVRIERFGDGDVGSETAQNALTSKGIDQLEFYFSANPGESVKPIVKVASGGEASRLMLILKTTARVAAQAKTAVFDEVDSGIGGRVAEAVGLKLKELAASHQVLCVTHQPQIACLADQHLFVEKEVVGGKTRIGVLDLDDAGRVEEIARMLTGAEITDTARQHAREMLSKRGNAAGK